MKAWIEPAGVIRDIAHGDPDAIYVPEVALLYSSEVPEGAVNGATLVDGEWVNPVPPEPLPLAQQYDTEPSPIAFQLMFTFQEGIAIRGSDDAGVKYFLRLLDDPRTSTVDLTLEANIQAIEYLASLNLITTDRAGTILKGLPL